MFRRHRSFYSDSRSKTSVLGITGAGKMMFFMAVLLASFLAVAEPTEVQTVESRLRETSFQGRILRQLAENQTQAEATEDLWLGIEQGDIELVFQALEAGADPNDQEGAGRTPLWAAVYFGEVEMSQEMLSYGADPNIPDFQGITPWLKGIQEYFDDIRPIIEAMIEAGAEINAAAPRIYEKATALELAVEHGHPRLVELLLESGADTEIADTKGYTPLITAAFYADHELVEELLSYNANVDAKDTDGLTAMHHAAVSGSPRVAQSLLDAGADINARTVVLNTPLILAVSWYGGLEIVDFLLSSGADANAVNSHGIGAIHEASAIDDDDVAVLQALIAAGADVDAGESDDLLTPLHLACNEGIEKNMKELLAKGAYVDPKSLTSLTPLHLSVRRTETPELVSLLLDAGSQVDALSNSSWTPLHYAAYWGSTAGVKLLLEKGANPFLTSSSGASPIDVVCQCSGTRSVPDLVGHLRSSVFCLNPACRSPEDKEAITEMFRAAIRDSTLNSLSEAPIGETPEPQSISSINNDHENRASDHSKALLAILCGVVTALGMREGLIM